MHARFVCSFLAQAVDCTFVGHAVKRLLHSIPNGIDSMAILNSSDEAVCRKKPTLPTTAT